MRFAYLSLSLFLLTSVASAKSTCDNYKSARPQFRAVVSSLSPASVRESVKKYTQFIVVCARNSGAPSSCAASASYKLTLKSGAASESEIATFGGAASFCADSCPAPEGSTFRAQLEAGGCP